MTVVELVVGLGITLLLIMTTGALLIGSTAVWTRRTAHGQADADAALAMQRITRDLSQALSFSIDDCGRSIYIVLPARAANGNGFLIPIQPERDEWGGPRIRWFRLQDGALYSSEREEPLIADMPEEDPDAAAPYFVFASVPGAPNRVEVTLISRRSTGKGDLVSRLTQQVTVRNMSGPP